MRRAGGLVVAVLAAAGAVVTTAVDTPADVSSGNGTTVTGTSGKGTVVAVPHTVQVTLTAGGCAPASVSVPAGPVTLVVANPSTPGVSEAALQRISDGVQLGEIEDVSAGMTGSLSVVLEQGAYRVACQAASGAGVQTRITVTAPQTRTLDARGERIHILLGQAAAAYAGYVRAETAALVTTARTLDDAVRAGDVAAARAAYLPARVHYERIEPVAESFGQLDPLIDERIDDVPAGREWSGFHHLERDIYTRGSVAGDGPVASELDLALRNLQFLVAREVVQPAQLADGAASLLDEVGSSKITGEEERYSHADAVDLVANVEGATQAVGDLMPALRLLDPALAADVQRRFDALHAAVSLIPPAAQADWTKATPALRASLSAAVDAAAEPLAQVAAEVAEG